MTTDAAALARAFHEAYERLAPEHGYETRRESAVPWDEVPERNRSLMTAVCREILAPRHRIGSDNGCRCSYCTRVRDAAG